VNRNLACFLTVACHFGNATGVVCDRPVSINSHGNTDRSQHANRSNAHTVKSTQVSRDKDHGTDS